MSKKFVLWFFSNAILTSLLSVSFSAYGTDVNISEKEDIHPNASTIEAQRAIIYQRGFTSNSTVEEYRPSFLIGFSNSPSKGFTMEGADLQFAYRPFGNFYVTSSVNYLADDVHVGFLFGF